MSMANFGNASKRTLEYDTTILQSAQSVLNVQKIQIILIKY